MTNIEQQWPFESAIELLWYNQLKHELNKIFEQYFATFELQILQYGGTRTTALVCFLYHTDLLVDIFSTQFEWYVAGREGL